MPDIYKNAISVGVTTVTSVYTAPVGQASIVLGLIISNTTGGSVTATVEVTDTSAAVTSKIVNAVPIPANDSIKVIKGEKIILEATDILKVTGSGTVDVTASILEDV